jgi:hypothetical protein
VLLRDEPSTAGCWQLHGNDVMATVQNGRLNNPVGQPGSPRVVEPPPLGVELEGTSCSAATGRQWPRLTSRHVRVRTVPSDGAPPLATEGRALPVPAAAPATTKIASMLVARTATPRRTGGGGPGPGLGLVLLLPAPRGGTGSQRHRFHVAMWISRACARIPDPSTVAAARPSSRGRPTGLRGNAAGAHNGTFVCSWLGPVARGNRTAGHPQALLDVALGLGLARPHVASRLRAMFRNSRG